jgi:WD40 repeat protein
MICLRISPDLDGYRAPKMKHWKSDALAVKGLGYSNEFFVGESKVSSSHAIWAFVLISFDCRNGAVWLLDLNSNGWSTLGHVTVHSRRVTAVAYSKRHETVVSGSLDSTVIAPSPPCTIYIYNTRFPSLRACTPSDHCILHRNKRFLPSMRGVCQVRVSRPLAQDGSSKVSVIAAPSPVNDLALLPDEVNFNQSPDGANSHAHMRLLASCHAREDFSRHSR